MDLHLNLNFINYKKKIVNLKYNTNNMKSLIINT